MEKRFGFLYQSSIALGILSTGFLAYNMIAMRVFAEQIFFERQTLSIAELFIVLGFSLVLSFDGLSFFWVLIRCRHSGRFTSGDIGMLFLGGLCPFLLLAVKVMIDEIGREYLLGWEVGGEWRILYILLVVQLIYNLLVLRRLLRDYRS